MIKQGMTNVGILEKKFKILRTSIMLGNIRDREELMSKYEVAAREMDEVKRNMYEEVLASKMYTTTSLEDEEARLKDLIEFIQNRVKERNDFIDDYIKITSNFLDDLPRVSLENELPGYKSRLDNICEYRNNCVEIEKENERLQKLRDELEERYDNKANNEVINSKLEDELIEEFNKLVTKDSYYSSLNYTDIESESLKVETSLREKYDVMNTFLSSYEALKSAGITGAEREEYLSYVQDARDDYYREAEKKYVLDLYKLVLAKETDYDKLYQKRLMIDEILKDRNRVRRELEINNRDDLQFFASLFNEQFSVIKSQKFNIENIDKLILDITECENKLDSLEKANNRPEILDLLREYSEEAPEVLKLDMPSENETVSVSTTDEGIGDVIDNLPDTMRVIPKAGNMVVKVEDPVKTNVKSATDTAKLVMKKVVIVLEPKKFNKKRDKLKEAEEELKTGVKPETLEEKYKDQKELKFEGDFLDLDISNDTENPYDDVFVTPDTPVVNLETTEVDDKSVKDTITLDSVKLNPYDEDQVTVPTEIFIEEPPEKKLDLFSQTDPFLDDNQYEIEDSSYDANKTMGNMPIIKNIGTVKPNNMLSKIEDAQKDNDDIILPTMGFTDTEKSDVPIVSENYIN
jgi:hypothetical protein